MAVIKKVTETLYSFSKEELLKILIKEDLIPKDETLVKIDYAGGNLLVNLSKNHQSNDLTVSVTGTLFEHFSEEQRKFLEQPLIDIGLNTRLFNRLKSRGWKNLGEVLFVGEEEVLKTKLTGPKTLLELKQVFKSKNIAWQSSL